MKELIFLMSILCFLGCIWWVVGTVTGNTVFKFIAKSLGIVGCIIPVVYWLDMLNVLTLN